MACACGGRPGQAEQQGGPLPGPAWVGGAPWEQPAALGDDMGREGEPGLGTSVAVVRPARRPHQLPVLQAGRASAERGACGRGHPGLPPADG